MTGAAHQLAAAVPILRGGAGGAAGAQRGAGPRSGKVAARYLAAFPAARVAEKGVPLRYIGALVVVPREGGGEGGMSTGYFGVSLEDVAKDFPLQAPPPLAQLASFMRECGHMTDASLFEDTGEKLRAMRKSIDAMKGLLAGDKQSYERVASRRGVLMKEVATCPEFAGKDSAALQQVAALTIIDYLRSLPGQGLVPKDAAFTIASRSADEMIRTEDAGTDLDMDKLGDDHRATLLSTSAGPGAPFLNALYPFLSLLHEHIDDANDIPDNDIHASDVAEDIHDIIFDEARSNDLDQDFGDVEEAWQLAVAMLIENYHQLQEGWPPGASLPGRPSPLRDLGNGDTCTTSATSDSDLGAVMAELEEMASSRQDQGRGVTISELPEAMQLMEFLEGDQEPDLATQPPSDPAAPEALPEEPSPDTESSAQPAAPKLIKTFPSDSAAPEASPEEPSPDVESSAKLAALKLIKKAGKEQYYDKEVVRRGSRSRMTTLALFEEMKSISTNIDEARSLKSVSQTERDLADESLTALENMLPAVPDLPPPPVRSQLDIVPEEEAAETQRTEEQAEEKQHSSDPSPAHLLMGTATANMSTAPHDDLHAAKKGMNSDTMVSPFDLLMRDNEQAAGDSGASPGVASSKAVLKQAVDPRKDAARAPEIGDAVLPTSLPASVNDAPSMSMPSPGGATSKKEWLENVQENF